ncbi:MAG: two-component system response regulator [Myxococcota bacterium]
MGIQTSFLDGVLEQAKEHSDILVVDDSPLILDTTRQLLSEEGYHVRTAANGREALARVQEQMPDVILLDLMMPLMDGWEFAARLKALPGGREPRILLLSAVRGLDLEAEGCSADDCLGKPYSVDDLLNKVAFAVTHSREQLDTQSPAFESPAQG